MYMHMYTMYMYINLAKPARSLYVFCSPDYYFEIYSQTGTGLTTLTAFLVQLRTYTQEQWPRQTLQTQVHHRSLPAIIVALQTCYYSITCILHS